MSTACNKAASSESNILYVICAISCTCRSPASSKHPYKLTDGQFDFNGHDSGDVILLLRLSR